MRTFVIADASKRKAKPVGVVIWRPCPEGDYGRFMLEVCSGYDATDLPLSLSFCANRRGRRATPQESEDWVRSRIVPENRHNIAEVLRANGLAEYDEVSLFAANQGRSSDDDLLAYEVDVPQDFIAAHMRASLGNAEPAADPAACEPPLADLIVNAVQRRRAGAKVSYAFVSLAEAESGANAALSSAGSSAETTGSHTAAQRIGALIRAERKRQGFTQKQLAARAGITQTVLSRTESGSGNPTLSLLEDIAAALGMQLDVCLGQ